jgi:hypothetical protein
VLVLTQEDFPVHPVEALYGERGIGLTPWVWGPRVDESGRLAGIHIERALKIRRDRPRGLEVCLSALAFSHTDQNLMVRRFREGLFCRLVKRASGSRAVAGGELLTSSTEPPFAKAPRRGRVPMALPARSCSSRLDEFSPGEFHAARSRKEGPEGGGVRDDDDARTLIDE